MRTDIITRRTASAWVSAIVFILFLSGCGDRTPIIEIDDGKGDPLKENMINANKISAQSESTQIQAFLDRHGWKASPLPSGAQYIIDQPGDGTPIAPDDKVAVTYSLEALDGTPFYSHQVDTLTVGRREQTQALDELLLRTSCHAQARMVAPSISAYGVTGDGDRVGSRTVIVYKITDIEKVKQ